MTSFRSVTHQPRVPSEIKMVSSSGEGLFEQKVNDLLRIGWCPFSDPVRTEEGRWVMMMVRYSSPGSMGPL